MEQKCMQVMKKSTLSTWMIRTKTQILRDNITCEAELVTIVYTCCTILKTHVHEAQ